MTLKSRLKRYSAKLRFDHVTHMTEWRHALLESLSRDRKRLSDFDIIRHVGKGASGRVYQVEDKQTKERLALKVIEKTTVFESEDTYRHAMDERIVLQMIREHPFILDMRYAFQNAKRLFIVTEFCGGGDMFEFMNRKVAPLDEDTTRFVAAEILLALEHLHSFGVVYRDLKLENILIDDEGHTRLADFGLTKVLMREDGTLRRTKTFCGTREYVAPEMLRGDAYDTVIDFWTFGILLYEMMSGRTPFYTADHNEIYKRIEKAPIFYPRNLSSEVRELLGKLLQRDPAQRLGAGKDGLEAIKNHEWFESIDWNALREGRGGVSPLKKAIKFFAQEDAKKKSPKSDGKKSKRQLKQEKALSSLLADIKEDSKYASFSSQNSSQHVVLRARSPKRGDKMLAGYSFFESSSQTTTPVAGSDSIGSTGNAACKRKSRRPTERTERKSSSSTRPSASTSEGLPRSSAASMDIDDDGKQGGTTQRVKPNANSLSPTGIRDAVDTHDDEGIAIVV